ncbi:MAG: ATP-dependent RNA helicase HrpA [Deltaproteobacteria bacterium]|nr:ATP-dependent RNA helicase HrpA [Deltaproteobacteria bacterium]
MNPRFNKSRQQVYTGPKPHPALARPIGFSLPERVYDPALPIIDKKDEIIQAISGHSVVIVSGETGSGKTTQLPKFCLDAGRGLSGVIGCTQPRRIAAMTVANRIAEELGETVGQSVGYKIRFTDRTSRHSVIKVMTDGILLAETLNDPFLNRYDTLIVDEAHERSLNIDFILGIVKTLLRKRNDLKLIITSATIDTDKFSKAFDHAPVIEVSGRMYPVEVRYLPPNPSSDENDEPTPVELAVKAVDRLCRQGPFGDVLIFMPTEQDIRETCELIEGRRLSGITVLPLFARLSAKDQARVFFPAVGRKIIVATNIAETSLTIPGVKYVIDAGLARISQYTPRSRTTSLQVRPISRSSADQRKGRCGRLENGICIRLYSEEDYLSRPQFTRPEILRSNLAEVILRMMALKLGSIADFPFIDQPDSRSITDGFDLLTELGAIQKTGDTTVKARKSGSSDLPFTLTEQGRLMSRIPVDPRLSRVLIQSRTEGCVPEIAIITAALCIQDPRERPVEKAQQADAMHRIFSDPSSDFIGLLNIWNHYNHLQETDKSSGRLKRFCSQHFLSFKRMREWRDIHAQLSEIVNEFGMLTCEMDPSSLRKTGTAGNLRDPEKNSRLIPDLPKGKHKNATDFPDRYSAIHRSILSGFLSNIAMKKEKNIFRAARDREVMVFPGSSLFNKSGNWIMAAEMVETSRLFARIVAGIDSKWLEELGKPLCRYTWSQAHWERSRGEVVALEQVSLFGLIIVSQRSVCYGRIDPVEASNIFVQSALVDGDVKKPFAFMLRNQNLIEEIQDMENRFRRKDILVSEADLYEFYRQRVPETICDIRTFQKFLKDRGEDGFLLMNREDLLQYAPDSEELAQYPDRVALGSNHFSCLYSFEPGSQEDGLTVQIPSSAAPTIPRESLDWMVPGLLKEKVGAMIKALPKVYRKKLVPISRTVDILVTEMPRETEILANALSRFIYQRFGIDIPASIWSEETLPDYLKMRIAVTSPEGKVICSGRDISVLKNLAPERISSAALDLARKNWERPSITEWNMPELPNAIDIQGEAGINWTLFPALVKNPDSGGVSLRLFEEPGEALLAHCRGVAGLVEIIYAREMKFMQKYLTISRHRTLLAEQWGGVKKIQKKLYHALLIRLFSKNIRSESEFIAHMEKTLPDMPFLAKNLLDASMEVLEALAEAGSSIEGLIRNNPANAAARQFWKDLKEQLRILVPEDFMIRYEPERFPHLIRYIRAIAIRAQRAWLDFDKDQGKAREIQLLADRRQDLQDRLSLHATDQKKQAAENLFWMIEEFKVSLYAQELKTAFPISRKRIEKAFEEIDRMV